jgi:hypothetical protein
MQHRDMCCVMYNMNKHGFLMERAVNKLFYINLFLFTSDFLYVSCFHPVEPLIIKHVISMAAT